MREINETIPLADKENCRSLITGALNHLNKLGIMLGEITLYQGKNWHKNKLTTTRFTVSVRAWA